MKSESVQFSNIAATPATFTLKGGNYALLTELRHEAAA
jgi:hypothetical protein